MKIKLYLLFTVIIFFSVLFLSIDIYAEDKGGNSSFASSDMPVYNPPVMNNSVNRRRIGGAAGSSHRGLTRGFGTSLSRELAKGLVDQNGGDEQTDTVRSVPEYLSPIAPKHVGLTSVPHPAIYFYISSDWRDDIEFILNAEGVLQPVLMIKIKGPHKAGILKVDLAKYGVSLMPDAEYEWFISIIPDKYDCLSKIFASGAVKYVKPSSDFTKTLKSISEERLDYVYAKEGYFYDAIDNVTNLIEIQEARNLRLQRASLMEQVELSFIAEYDRK